MQINTNKHKNISGQAITEVVLGLVIAGIIVGSAALALVLVLRSNQESGFLQVASFYMQEYANNIEVVADGDWHKLYDLPTKTSSTQYLIAVSGTSYVVEAGVEGLVGDGIRNGLIGHWKLDENVTSTAYDSSVNGNQGTASGTVALGTSTCAVGNCFNFDGSNASVFIGDITALQVTSSVSITAWIYADSWSAEQPTIFDNFAASPQLGYALSVEDNVGIKKVSFMGSVDGSAVSFSLESDTALVTGTLYHVAGVYDSAAQTAVVYLNGQAESSTASAPMSLYSGSGDIYIGQRDESGNEKFWDGTIDDVRVYNRALSGDEIWTMYNSQNYSRYFTIENVSRNPSTNDIETTYNASNDDPSTQKITIYVSYTKNNETRTISSVKFLTRSNNNVSIQTDWGGGPGSLGPVTGATNAFETSTNVNISSGTGVIILEGY